MIGTPSSSAVATSESAEIGHVRKGQDVQAMLEKSNGSREEITRLDGPITSPLEVDQEDVLPDGGYGWVCVFCVFWLNVCSWGISSVMWTFLSVQYVPSRVRN